MGHDAPRLARITNTFSSVKRFIGKSFDSKTVKDDAQGVPYEVVAAPDGGVAMRCPALGADVTPIEVSRHILPLLSQPPRPAPALSEGDIKRAVVTVPAYFDDAQCAATIERANERASRRSSCCTSRRRCCVRRRRGTTTVFALTSARTFDVSVLDVGGGTVEVLATGGDAHLGGDDSIAPSRCGSRRRRRI